MDLTLQLDCFINGVIIVPGLGCRRARCGTAFGQDEIAIFDKLFIPVIVIADRLVSTLPEENDCISIQLKCCISCYTLHATVFPATCQDSEQPVASTAASSEKHDSQVIYSHGDFSQHSYPAFRIFAYALDYMSHLMLLILSYKFFLFMLILYKLFLCRYIQEMRRAIPSPHSTSSSPDSAAPRHQWHHPSL